MYSIKSIREDLRNIRYYYSRKDLFDKSSHRIGESEVLQKIELYNKLVCKAKPRLYDLYVSIYLENNSQESMAERLGYSPVYICQLNTELARFIQKELDKEGKDND